MTLWAIGDIAVAKVTENHCTSPFSGRSCGASIVKGELYPVEGVVSRPDLGGFCFLDIGQKNASGDRVMYRQDWFEKPMTGLRKLRNQLTSPVDTGKPDKVREPDRELEDA